MGENVHCLSAKYDKSRFSHPIVQKELPTDRVILFIESAQESGDGHNQYAALVESIESQTNIEIEKIHLSDLSDVSDFRSSYQIIFQKLYEEVDKDNRLWLNISSEPHIVNFCFLHAINSLQLNPPGLKFPREQVHVYQTIGQPIIDELRAYVQTVSKRAISIESTVDRQLEILDDLRKHLQHDGDHTDGKEIFDLLTELEIRIRDIERNSLSERASKLSQDLDEHGITRFSSVRKLPLPPTGELGDYERSLLISLGAMEKADSISELIDKWLKLGLKGVENMLHKHLEMDADETFNQYQETLSSGIRSTVQNNLNNLVRKGYITKEKHGRARRIELTENGILWLLARGYTLGNDPDPTQPGEFELITTESLMRLDLPLGE